MRIAMCLTTRSEPQMHEICLAQLEKVRPVLVLTREYALRKLTKWTVAPITSTIRGISSEVPIGPQNGIDHPSVISLDNIMTIDVSQIGKTLGFLTPEQEVQLTTALIKTFELVTDDPYTQIPLRAI